MTPAEPAAEPPVEPPVEGVWRDFAHERLWRVTDELLGEATTLLARAVAQDHRKVDHVIGVARGGIAPARLLATALGATVHTVDAQHNTSDTVYRQATGDVHVDLQRLAHLHDLPMTGRILVVDDICGSGATLRRVCRELQRYRTPQSRLLSAVLCLNTGASIAPDYAIWAVSDWVVFPWERPPADWPTTAPTSTSPTSTSPTAVPLPAVPLPIPREVIRHA